MAIVHPKVRDVMNKISIFIIFLMVWIGLDYILAIINYAVWMRQHTDLFGAPFVRLYLAFIIVGILMYALVGFTFMFRSLKYAMVKRDQRNDLVLGVASVYFPATLPMFVIVYNQIFFYGTFSLLQAVSFLVTCVSCGLCSTVVWFGYMWVASSWLEKHFPQGTQKAIDGVPYLLVVGNTVFDDSVI
eukprot:TRINITY_DN41749_c0_g1_i1.p1 TRINITY_DN41749_c0_g1~~TRINITY_DN41749_c0_g1_i1.p1  ORF type:complete len:187 (+),score=10.46 TRINITY_DN41749_c0_g1_i1:191-751(+)